MNALKQWCIITVNFNLWSDTIECVRSLQAAGACLEQIVVVDNASTDQSPEHIRAALGEEPVIVVSEENGGYAHGINLGVQYAMAHDCQWLLLLNNDTVVDPDFLQQMTQAADGKPDTMFGPAILYYDQPELVWSMGDLRVRGTMFGYNPFHDRPVRANLPDLLPVEFLNGCCMLVHRSVFETVGLWDTSYYMYGEEVDFCWRAHKAGFSMVTVTGARMLHKVSRSAGKIGSRALYLRVRNQNWFYRRYASVAQAVLMAGLSFLRNAAFSLKRALTGEGREAFIPLQGWFDGWFRMKA